MKDPYAFGFYSACFALLVVVGANIYGTITGGGADATTAAHQLIHSVSAMAEALAAVAIAGIAFRAYGTWKDETRHHKALTIIWDANVAFREIEMGFNEWFFGPNAGGKSEGEQIKINALLSASPLGISLRNFKKQCILLDKIVVKDRWEWVNYANELDMLARALSVDAFRPASKGKISNTLIDFMYSREGETLQRTQSEWEMLMQTIEQKLAHLEVVYG
jgi:hypothetical protein